MPKIKARLPALQGHLAHKTGSLKRGIIVLHIPTALIDGPCSLFQPFGSRAPI